MAKYMISYDAPALTDYQPFYDAMSECNAAHLLESVWLISTTWNATKLRNWTNELLGSKANVAVIQIGGNWATRRVKEDATQWLKDNL